MGKRAISLRYIWSGSRTLTSLDEAVTKAGSRLSGGASRAREGGGERVVQVRVQGHVKPGAVHGRFVHVVHVVYFVEIVVQAVVRIAFARLGVQPVPGRITRIRLGCA